MSRRVRQSGRSSHLDRVRDRSGGDQIPTHGTAVTLPAQRHRQGSWQVIHHQQSANALPQRVKKPSACRLGLADGTAAPHYVKLAVEANGLGVVVTATTHRTQHCRDIRPRLPRPSERGVLPDTWCGVTTPHSESSRHGWVTILSITLAPGSRRRSFRQSPLRRPDGANTYLLGFQIAAGEDTSTVTQCANNGSYPISSAPRRPRRMPLPSRVDAAGEFHPDAGADLHSVAVDCLADAGGPGTPDYNRDTDLSRGCGMDAGSRGSYAHLASSSLHRAPRRPEVDIINTTSCTASGSWTGSQPQPVEARHHRAATAGTACLYADLQ